MNVEEQQLIDGLFKRLKEAEQQGEARDTQAEGHIQKRVGEHPTAPYYMAQVILIQEASLKQLDQRVRDLETQVSKLQQEQTTRPAAGGSFLSGLFGGSNASSTKPAPSSGSSLSPTGQPVAPVGASTGRGWSEPGYRSSNQPMAMASSGGGGGFLAGAVQTAVGVAGGMLLAETISGLFKDDAPETVVESVVTPEPEPSAPSFFQSDDAFAQQTDFEEYDEGDDLFSGDDDSFV